MIATIVHVFVKKEHIEDFIKSTQKNHEGSIKENGNLRFDVLQDSSDIGKFVLYEVYETEEAIAAHKETPHYLKWRETVAPWMDRPREGIKHKMLFP